MPTRMPTPSTPAATHTSGMLESSSLAAAASTESGSPDGIVVEGLACEEVVVDSARDAVVVERSRATVVVGSVLATSVTC